jgi:hypothetical protein
MIPDLAPVILMPLVHFGAGFCPCLHGGRDAANGEIGQQTERAYFTDQPDYAKAIITHGLHLPGISYTV